METDSLTPPELPNLPGMPAAAAAERPVQEGASLPPQAVADLCRRMGEEMGKVIVGQERVKELLFIALLARGHGLFQGVPGLGKTLLVHSLAQVTSGTFSRIQFTPDLMPGDITGTDVLEEDRSTGRRTLRFIPGPIFAHLVLADEINRTPPRTQAALLQAMQEGQVTASGQTLPLPPTFQVFATSNPLEQEGTYPLPEAQLDRFMFLIPVDYPTEEEERRIAVASLQREEASLRPIIDPDTLLQMQKLARLVPVSEEVATYAVRLARSSRPGPGALASVNEQVAFGAGPRASQYLVAGGKARALLQGRFAASREDVKAVAEAVLAHRILLNYRATASGVTTRDVVFRLVEAADGSGSSRL